MYFFYFLLSYYEGLNLYLSQTFSLFQSNFTAFKAFRIRTSRFQGAFFFCQLLFSSVLWNASKTLSAPRKRKQKKSYPIAQLLAHLQRQVLAVHVHVEVLGLVELAKVGGDLGPLQLTVIQILELLHKLDAVVVLALDKRMLGHLNRDG